jgi:hypothetical protein
MSDNGLLGQALPLAIPWIGRRRARPTLTSFARLLVQKVRTASCANLTALSRQVPDEDAVRAVRNPSASAHSCCRQTSEDRVGPDN